MPPLQNDGTAAPKEFRGAGNSSRLKVRRSGFKSQLCHYWPYDLGQITEPLSLRFFICKMKTIISDFPNWQNS